MNRRYLLKSIGLAPLAAVVPAAAAETEVPIVKCNALPREFENGEIVLEDRFGNSVRITPLGITMTRGDISRTTSLKSK